MYVFQLDEAIGHLRNLKAKLGDVTPAGQFVLKCPKVSNEIICTYRTYSCIRVYILNCTFSMVFILGY